MHEMSVRTAQDLSPESGHDFGNLCPATPGLPRCLSARTGVVEPLYQAPSGVDGSGDHLQVFL